MKKAPNKKKREGFWKAYEKADIKNYRKVWNVGKKVIQEEGYPLKKAKTGRNPNLDLWMCVNIAIIYVYFNDSFRETEQLLFLLTNKRLDHSNIVRWFGKLEPEYIDKLVYKIHTKIIRENDEGTT